MRTDTPVTVYRKDYQPYPYDIPVSYTHLQADGTKKAASSLAAFLGGILSKLQIERFPSSASGFRKPKK